MFTLKNSSIFLIVLSACASSPPAQEKPLFHFLPDSSYRQITHYVSEYASNQPEMLRKIQATLCDGSRPRLKITYSTTVRLPIEKGLGLDIASADRQEIIDGLRTFFHDKFFHVSANSDLGHGLIFRQFLDNDSRTIGVPYADDMDLLVHGFAFMLPKDFIISHLNPLLAKSWSDPAALSWYGYRENASYTMQFSPSKTINNNWNIWEGIMAYSTHIQEAPQANGTIKFNLNMDLDLFCAYAVPITDLISR